MKQDDSEFNEIMHTGYDNALLYWDSLLYTQTDLLLPYELTFFFSCSEWLSANNILDAGCGNGAYLSELKNFFPNKKYTGLDISPDFINIAQANNYNKNIDYQNNDFFKHLPINKYDVILMRFIVQHMKGLNNIFLHASDLLTSSGSLIIIEPAPSFFMNIPHTPNFHRLLCEIEKASAKLNTNRVKLNHLSENLKQNPVMKFVEEKLLIIPQCGTIKNTKLLQMFMLWVEIFEKAQAFPFQYDSVYSELEEWSKNSHCFAQIAIKTYHLRTNNV